MTLEKFPAGQATTEKAVEVYLRLIRAFFPELDPQPETFDIESENGKKPYLGINLIGTRILLFYVGGSTVYVAVYYRQIKSRGTVASVFLPHEETILFNMGGWEKVREFLRQEQENLKSATIVQEFGIQSHPLYDEH